MLIRVKKMWQNKKYLYLILIILSFLVYANSFNNAFVSDDIDGIVKNPLISHPLYFWLSPSNLLDSLIYLIAGNNPFPYHLTSIILHSIATIFVFFFLRLFFNTESSFLGASLFAVHPIHTEAVTWVAGRPYIITALFILGTYFLYNSAVDAKNTSKKFKPLPYLICLVFFSYYITRNFSFYSFFPFLLILSDVTFKRWRKNWKWWLPFFAIVLLRMFLARSIISGRITSVAKEVGMMGSLWTNPVYNMTYSIFTHLGLVIWPAKLTLYHEPPVITRFALNAELIILAILALALPFIFKKARPLFFAIALFVIFLAPTYSPVMVSWLVAERYLYFPSIAFSIFAAFFYERIYKTRILTNQKPNSHESIRENLCVIRVHSCYGNLILAVVIFIIAAYGVRTVARNEDWKRPERFWRETALVSFLSPRAHNNMGDIYYQEGNIGGAIREFKKAIELKSNYADAYYNLANVYHRIGNLQEAIKFYQSAISYKPELFEAHFNLGLIYLNNTNQVGLAVEHFKQAVVIRPDDVNARAALNIAIEKQKRNY